MAMYMFDDKIIKNPVKIFNYDEKTRFKKIYALEKILEHLEEGTKDTRKREQMRSKVALGTIKKWMQTGEKIWEKHPWPIW